MAAYAALVSLMNNIEQMMNHPRVSNYLDNKQIQPLLEKADLLLDIIEGNKYGGGNKEAEDLERQITFAAHAAEDVIESHIVDQIHAAEDVYELHIVDQIYAAEDVNELHIIDQMQAIKDVNEFLMGFNQSLDGETSSSFMRNVQKKIRDMKKEVRHLMRRMVCAAQIEAGTSPICSPVEKKCYGALLQEKIEDMDAVVGKAMEVVKEKEGSKEEQPTHSKPLLERGETIAMVGLDEELTQLMDELTGHQSNRHIISIVGMGGMGKTTLAKNIYANPLIIERFDIRAWATVSQQYNAREIISQLLSSLGKSTSGSVDELGEKLHKTLIGRRYLVVLDDIWNVEAWDEVRRYLPDYGNSSRVVLTTRLSNVASVCGSSCFTMNLLDKDESWKLFCEKALFPQKDDPLQLEDIGKKIVRLCKGLALSIVVIGGLLKSPRTVEYWEGVAKGLKSNADSKEKEESLDILSLSYNHLPPHLKPCFLYMGIFKEDSEIRVSTVTRLWVAEGFIRPNGTQVLEEIAEGYLRDLIDRNLILVGRRRCNGEIGSCGIHDLLRDLCVKVAEQQEFFHVRKYGEIQSRDRRFACHPYQEDIGSPLARSILAKNCHAESIKCKLLRVLVDAEYCYDPSPEEVFCLYENVNLRYLAYQHPSFLDTTSWKLLPASVFLIWNLQALIITMRLMTHLLIAPSDIWKMRQLRHIKYPRIYLPPPPPPSDHGQDNLFILENLQTLTTAVNLRLSEADIIIPNIKKLRLIYRDDWQGYDDSLIECLCYLDRLHKLESLKIEINLRNQVQAPNYEKLAFPSSLKKLSLSHCRLHWNDLRMIGSLPRLQVLNLEKLSVTEGEQWSPADGQFLHLKYLKIEECNLYIWDADNSHFPVLEKIVLRKLINLEEIPMDMGDIPTLELIRVDLCSESAAISAMRIKEDQLESQDNDALQIQLRIARSDLESFKEKVETEQLTLSYIQLESGY